MITGFGGERQLRGRGRRRVVDEGTGYPYIASIDFQFSITGTVLLIDFEWDETKAASNLRQHGFGCYLARRVFLEVSCVEFDVSRAGDGEARFKRVGEFHGKFVTIVVTRRAGIVRIISVRRSNSTEERRYGDHTSQG